MGNLRFDELAKRLVALTSRRVFSAALGAAMLGTLRSSDQPNGALARKRRKRKKRRNGSCAPTCRDKDCGSDGCGGDCGECAPEDVCDEGQCVCKPNCGGKECGPDGCGDQCGTCRAGDTCQGGGCVCATAGALGPGDICDSASQCCPYPDVERFCTHGEGACPTFFKACRFGLGGKCFGSCDCEGDLECRDGTCRCPGDRDYLPGVGCCAEGLTRCGDRCCQPGTCNGCPPFLGCRCTTFP